MYASVDVRSLLLKHSSCAHFTETNNNCVLNGRHVGHASSDNVLALLCSVQCMSLYEVHVGQLLFWLVLCSLRATRKWSTLLFRWLIWPMSVVRSANSPAKRRIRINQCTFRGMIEPHPHWRFLPRCMECRRGLTMRFLSVRLSIRPSVCLSVKRVHCDKTEERYV